MNAGHWRKRLLQKVQSALISSLEIGDEKKSLNPIFLSKISAYRAPMDFSVAPKFDERIQVFPEKICARIWNLKKYG